MTPRAFVGWYRAAWRDYRGYIAFTTVWFLGGAVVGAALSVTGVDFLALIGVENLRDVLPDVSGLSRFELFLTILVNNSRAYAVFILGAASFGTFTLLALGFNGLLIGYVVIQAIETRGVLFVVLGIAPHGIFELPALFVAAAVAIRVVVRTLLRLSGPVLSSSAAPVWLPPAQDSVMSRVEWRRTGLVVVTAYIVLAFAAAVEAFVTASLLAAVFG